MKEEEVVYETVKVEEVAEVVKVVEEVEVVQVVEEKVKDKESVVE
jgi:hypothetical protein